MKIISLNLLGQFQPTGKDHCVKKKNYKFIRIKFLSSVKRVIYSKIVLDVHSSLLSPVTQLRKDPTKTGAVSSGWLKSLCHIFKDK